MVRAASFWPTMRSKRRPDTVSGPVLSKSAIPLAAKPCYDWILDVPRFDRESSGGQSAYRERKGQLEMDLRCKQTRSDAYGTAMPRIELNGEYDLSSKDDIASLFRSLRADGPAVIDMVKVTYIDSTFLKELAGLRSRFKQHPITLLGINKNLQRILHIANFDGLFEIVEAQA